MNNKEDINPITLEALEIQDTSFSSQRKTSFRGDVLKIAFGTTFAQALVILASPFLTRLYSPEAFGVLALFSSITSIIIVISCMRYEFSILLPKSDKEAANLLGVSLIFVTLISILTIPGIWWGRGVFLHWLNAPALAPYLWLIPPAVFIGGAFLALNYWNSRTKRFTRLSVARVTSSVTTVSAQLGAGYAGYATGGSLIGASVAGQAVSAVVLGGQIWRDDRKLLRESIHWQDMISGLRRHRKFPIYTTWAALLNTMSWQLPVVLLSAFFSPIIVGYYALGFRILQMPMNLIGSALGQVFSQRAAEAQNKKALTPLVENVFRKLIMVGLFPMFMLTIVGRDLYSTVFGPNWAEAGVYTQILSIWALVWFISSPLATLFNVLEKQEFLLKLNIVIFASRLLSLGIGGYLGNARLAILLFSISGIVLYGYLNLFIMKSAGVLWSKIANIVLKNILFSLPFIIIQIWVTIISPNRLLRLSVAAVLSLFYFFPLLIKQLNSLRWTRVSRS